MAVDNKTIGKFHLADIPPSPRGIPQIEVTFDIDANGILNVNAKDKATSKEQSIRIEASSGLSDNEIDKMVNDAKKHEMEDKEKRDKIDLINQAEHLIYETEKNINEQGEKLDDTEKNNLTEKVEALKKAKDGGNLDELKKAMDDLNASWSAVAAKMQESAQTEADVSEQNKETDNKKKKEGEIEDADFEVVD